MMELLLVIGWFAFGFLAFGIINGYLRDEFTITYDEFHWDDALMYAFTVICGAIAFVVTILMTITGFIKYRGLNFRYGPEPQEKIDAAWKKFDGQ